MANGLFSIADRKFNEEIYNKLKEKLGEDVEIYAPQFNLAINDKTKSASSIDIYNGDTEKLEWANILLAVLDGEDLGVATEIGFVAGWNDAYKTSLKNKRLLLAYTQTTEIYQKHIPKTKIKICKVVALPSVSIHT